MCDEALGDFVLAPVADVFIGTRMRRHCGYFGPVNVEMVKPRQRLRIGGSWAGQTSHQRLCAETTDQGSEGWN